MPNANVVVSRAQIAPALCKVETTYGTDAGPVAGTDDLQTFDSPNPVQVQPTFVNFRQMRLSSFTPNKRIPTMRSLAISARTLFQGSGTAGDTAVNGFAGLDALLRAGGADVATVLNTSITYTPQDISSFESATFYVNLHGYVWKCLGMVGNIRISGNPRSGLDTQFDGLALYQDPVALGAEFTGWTGGTIRALPALASACSIDNGAAYDPILSSFNFDFGYRVSIIEDVCDPVGIGKVIREDAEPTLELAIIADTSGSAAITFDEWYANMFSSTLHNVSLTFGSQAGNTVKFDFPEAQLQNIRLQETNGVRQFVHSYLLTSATENGEWKITIT